MRSGKSFLQAYCLMAVIVLLAGCTESKPKPVDLNGKLEAKLLVTAPGPIVAMAADKNDTVYAVVHEKGDILKITPDGKATTLYSGLKICPFSAFPAITVLPNGDVVASDCEDNDRETIIKIDPAGNKTNLTTLDKETHVMSITSDSAGKVFVGLLYMSKDTKISEISNHVTWLQPPTSPALCPR